MPSRLDVMVDAFQDELQKIAAQVPKAPGKLGKVLPLMAAGAGTWEVARRANKDRRLGRQVRLQQGL